MDDPFDKTQDKFEKAYNKALRFLSYRQRSEKEVRDNLKKPKRNKEGANSLIIDQVINKLIEQRFINDEEFARAWVASRNRSKPRSNYVIKLELRQKGITDRVIENLFSSPESVTPDLDLARKLVDKKMRRLEGLPVEKINIKLQQALLSKGFSWDTIKQVLVDESDEKEV